MRDETIANSCSYLFLLIKKYGIIVNTLLAQKMIIKMVVVVMNI